MFFSGMAALVCQSVWMRSLGLVLGSGSQSAGICLAVFMAGMALGSWGAKRFFVGRSLQGYVLAEAATAAFSLLSLAWLHASPLRFFLPALALLPSALFSGAALPLLLGHLEGSREGYPALFSRLNGISSLGAAVGLGLAYFAAVPALGLQGSVALAAGMNLAAAGLAWGLPAIPPPPPQPPAAPSLQPALLAWLSGAVTFMLEVGWARALSLSLGSSVYAFSLMLLATLLGLAAGAWACVRWMPRMPDARAAVTRLYLALGLGALAQLWLCGWLPEIYFECLRRMPPSFAGALAVGFALALPILGLATVPLGMLFPLLARLGKNPGQSAQSASGRIFAFNAWGAVAGALVASLLLIPRLGMQPLFFIAAALAWLAWAWLRRSPWALALPAACLLLSAHLRPWNPDLMGSGVAIYGAGPYQRIPRELSLAEALHQSQDLLFYREGAEGLVMVTESKAGRGRTLVINGKADASDGSDRATQKLFGHLPFLLNPHLDSLLLVGWGSGCSAGSASLHPFRSLSCYELVPATLEAAPFFAALQHGVLQDPRFRLLPMDARGGLGASPETYDAISSEPSNPWISGVANLFTLEFYSLAKSRLKPGGVFLQFFHLYEMSEDDLKAQFRTLAAAFPYAGVFVVPPEDRDKLSADLILAGGLAPLRLDMDVAAGFFKNPGLAQDLAGVGVEDAAGLVAAWSIGRDAMLGWAGQGPLNSDDRPRLEYSAPLQLYQDEAARLRGNLALFNALDRLAAAGPLPAGTAAGLRRFAGIYLARNRLAQAGALFRKSLELEKNSAEALAGLGEAERHQGKPEEAEALLRRALALDPRLGHAAFELGMLLLEKGSAVEARALFGKWLVKNPRDADAAYGMAASAAQSRRWDEAERYASMALAAQPRHAATRSLLSQIKLMAAQ